MRRLWEMDGGTSGQKLQKWHDILKAEAAVAPPSARDKSPDDGRARRKREKEERKSRRSRRRGDGQAPQQRQPVHGGAEATRGEADKKAEVDHKNLTESMAAKMVEKDGIGDKINREELLECLELIERSMASSIAEEAPAPPAAGKAAAATTKKRREGKKKRSAESDSTDVSQSLRDEAADDDGGGGGGRKTESDFFIEVIIDELKKENRDLKFDLMAREKQLEKAAEKVKEVLDENAKLAKRLDTAVARAQDQAEAFKLAAEAKDEEHSRSVRRLEERIERLEVAAGPGDVDRRRAEGLEEGMAVAEELRKRLAESEKKNHNLEKYVDEMKRSYEAVFGDVNAAAAETKAPAESARGGD